MEIQDLGEEFMRPIVSGWLGCIDQAKRIETPFRTVASQCTGFFAGVQGFMWEDKYRNQFIGKGVNPRFRITIAKAFELVALFGPTLYYRNPYRHVLPRENNSFSPEEIQALQDPMLMQMLQQSQMEDQQRLAKRSIRAKLYADYLNYTPEEQPGGGLKQHGEDAITEALVKGRGCLWVEPYKMPSSQRWLTGCFYDSVDNLHVDPDSESCSLDDATWICRERVQPYRDVEDRFNLPRDILKDKGVMMSADSQAADEVNREGPERSKDLIKYFEIWSKAGVGSKFEGAGGSTRVNETFDDMVGKYAYIVVANGVPWPLNAPAKKVSKAEEREVQQMFNWPVPYWTDEKWPVALLDFYRKPNSAWPIAPMAPGLGELTFLNVMIAHLCNRIWSSSRDLIAVLKSAEDEVKTWLEKGDDQTVIAISDMGGNRKISDLIQVLQQPGVNFDSWRIIEKISTDFDKRVGLSELLYGMNPGGTQSRTATDSRAKESKVSVRPEYMASCVERWFKEASVMEKMCARFFVTGRDVAPQMGNFNAALWDKLITEQDPEAVVRDLDVTIEAGSIRRPNKDREVENMNQLFPALSAILDKHADMTTDTQPINNLINEFGKAIEHDTSSLNMGQRQPPPPSEEEQQMQQQMQQIQMESQKAEIQAKQTEAQSKQMDAQIKMSEGQMKIQQMQLKFQGDQQSGQMKMAIEQSKAASDQEAQQLDFMFRQQEAGIDAQKSSTELETDLLKHVQEMRQDEEVHDQEMKQAAQKHRLEMAMSRQETTSNGNGKTK